MNTPLKDPWVMLGVSRDADDSAIKRAYRKLAREYHPDRNPGDEAAAAYFQDIARAFDAIRSEQTRASWLAQNEGIGSAESLFEPMDGKGFSDPFAAPSAGLRSDAPQPVEHDLEISFAQAFSGAQVPVEIDVEEACGLCGGSGSAPGYRPITCQVCHGRGEHSAGRANSKCTACNGKGYIVERPCGACTGEGITHERRTVVLDIPAGVVNDHTLRVPASRGRVGVSDILVHIKVGESNVFKRTLRDPADLLIDVPITYAEACLGRSVKIPTPEKPIALRIQPGSPSGKALRIPNQGMPRMDNPSERGHLYARLNVVIPSALSTQQHRLITQLAHYDDSDALRIHLFNGGGNPLV